MDGQVRPKVMDYDHSADARNRPRYHWRAVAVVWLPVLAAFAIACFDKPVASWVFRDKLPASIKHSSLAYVIKVPGNFLLGTVPIAALAWLAGGRRRGGYAVALILLSGVLAGLFYTLSKWAVGRPRPYTTERIADPLEAHPFAHGIRGLWTANNQAFPSGHTCLAFSTATALSLLWPRGTPLFFLWPILIGVERVLENAHYPSDVLCGALFGIMAAWTAQWALRPLAERAKADSGVGHG